MGENRSYGSTGSKNCLIKTLIIAVTVALLPSILSGEVNVQANTGTTFPEQFIRGDLNGNGISADAGDLVIMKRTSIGEIQADPGYDLNDNGQFADAGDLVLMKRASTGEIDLQTLSVQSSTGNGTVYFHTNAGTIENITAVNPDAIPEPPPGGINLSYGLFRFNISNLTPGASATLTLTFPESLPENTVYWKYGPTSVNTSLHWHSIASTINYNKLVITIMDGGPGDNDLAVNGEIKDDGGPSIPAPAMSCSALNNYIGTVGVKDTSGTNHPGWAGVTDYLSIEHDIKYYGTKKQVTNLWCEPKKKFYNDTATCQRECKASLGGFTGICEPAGTVTCITAENLQANFTAPLVIKRIDWLPIRPISDACKAEKEKWEKEVDTHEAKHAEDIKTILDDANQRWRSKTFEACGETYELAKKRLDEKISSAAADEEANIKRLINEKSNEFHNSPAGKLRELNCTICN